MKVASLEAEAQAVEAARQAADQLAAELNKKVQQLQELKEAHQVATWSSQDPSLAAIHGSLSAAIREQSRLKVPPASLVSNMRHSTPASS
jgi:hypothetical protein